MHAFAGCNYDNFRKPWRRKFIFARPVYLQGILVKFTYECHWVTVLIRGWLWCLRLEGILFFTFLKVNFLKSVRLVQKSLLTNHTKIRNETICCVLYKKYHVRHHVIKLATTLNSYSECTWLLTENWSSQRSGITANGSWYCNRFIAIINDEPIVGPLFSSVPHQGTIMATSSTLTVGLHSTTMIKLYVINIVQKSGKLQQ